MNTFYPNTFLVQTSSRPENGVEQPGSQRWFWAGIFLHLPLVLLMSRFEIISTIHALLVMLIGLYFLISDKTPQRLVYLSAYIAGAEVLWRMTDARIFWETGKIALMGFFFLGVLRWGRGRIGLLPLVFAAPLLISTPYTLQSLPLNEARQQISFNLFGLLTLAAGLAFFSSLQLSQQQIEKTLRSLVLPIAGIAFLVLFKILTVGSIEFNLESNNATSGGYGPNQVSAVLGLAAMACWLLVLLLPAFNWDRTLLLGMSAAFLLQAVFTFSRGGVLNVLLATPMATFFLMRSSSRSVKAALMGLMLIGIVAYFLLPQMNAVSGGMLETRYQELDTTGRLDISKLDLQIWRDHFVFGVGPGMSSYYRIPFLGKLVAPHTEYSRLVAEHGIIGIWAMLLMGGIAIFTYLKAPNAWTKGLVVAFMVWALAEMAHAAMRIAVISFLMAIPFALLEKEK